MGLKQDYGYQFERVWRAYPRKVGKGAAAKAFRNLKLTPEEVDELVAHIEERKRFDVNWVEGKYVCHLSTFLNQGRWDDEYQRVRSSSPTHKMFHVEHSEPVNRGNPDVIDAMLSDLQRDLNGRVH